MTLKTYIALLCALLCAIVYYGTEEPFERLPYAIGACGFAVAAVIEFMRHLDTHD